MASYRFFPAADRRQDEIWEYTCKQWGENQAKQYIQGLHDHLQKLADKKIPWRPLPAGLVVPSDLDISIFFSRHEKHYIFFRELSSNAIGVLSILHGAMQIPVRLNEDLERISEKEEE
jgi:plasmid stabilization system protein ParE